LLQASSARSEARRQGAPRDPQRGFAAIKRAGWADRRAATAQSVPRGVLDEIGRTTAARKTVLADSDCAEVPGAFVGRELEALPRHEEQREGLPVATE